MTEVGAALRSYKIGGTPICWGFAEDEMPHGGQGQVLAPWPNRIASGRYVFGDTVGRAAIDEPAFDNAIHGLVRWMTFRPVALEPDVLRLETLLHPQPAYPFDLLLSVEYRLVADGCEVTTEARNLGDRPAPFGLGFHDYLDAGPGAVDGAELDVRARTRLLLDGRRLPVGEETVAGTPFAAISPHGSCRRPIGALHLDDCFGDLERDAEDIWHATFVRGGGPLDTIEVWADGSFSWAMVYSGDTLAPAARRRALAIEPMTCPPNAFRTGRDLIVLEPGATFRGRWGIRLPRLQR